MKYKNIPNSTAQVPAYSPLPDSNTVTLDLQKLARNAQVIKKLKAHWFGGQR